MPNIGRDRWRRGRNRFISVTAGKVRQSIFGDVKRPIGRSLRRHAFTKAISRRPLPTDESLFLAVPSQIWVSLGAPVNQHPLKPLCVKFRSKKLNLNFFALMVALQSRYSRRNFESWTRVKKHALSIGEVYLLLSFEIHRNLSNLALKIAFSWSFIDFYQI